MKEKSTRHNSINVPIPNWYGVIDISDVTKVQMYLVGPYLGKFKDKRMIVAV